MRTIRTRENPNLDKRFRHLFYGELEIGQLIITGKNYFVAMIGKEFLYPIFKYKSNKSQLQKDIESDYLKIVRELSENIGESRFNSDGIDLYLYRKLDKPTGNKVTYF